MAKMYPPSLSFNNEIPSSERLLYEIFQSQLDADFIVFHSVAWLGRGARGQLSDGEADFIIVHKAYGILVIEAKGGRIRYNANLPTDQQWQTIDRFEQKHQLKYSPFEQAKRSKHALWNKLKELPRFKQPKLLFGHAVAFPDITADFEILPPDTDQSTIIDSRDLTTIQPKIIQIYQQWQGNQRFESLTPATVDLIIQLLAPVISIDISLGSRINQYQAQLLTLTQQQFQTLNMLRRQRQALITGCAGSGKTMLALEKAKRLATNEAMNVLLLCFNRRLANHLKTLSSGIQNVQVYTFHEFCSTICSQYHINSSKPANIDETTYYRYFLPEQAFLAGDNLSEETKFDALIIDEGQDFAENWWDILTIFIKPNPIFYIFYDNNQRVYQESNTFPINQDPFYLDINCRNTQKIHQAVRYFYQGSDAETISAQGPEGETIEVLLYETPQQERELLGEILGRLHNQEQILAKQIVILTPYSPQNLNLANTTIAGYIISDKPRNPQQILCSSIQGYKGLEAPVVILTGLDERIDAGEVEQLQTILYIACSRASGHLIVLLPKSAPAKIRKAFTG